MHRVRRVQEPAIMAAMTLSADWTNYSFGPYVIENNVWNKGTLVNGVDYRQTISFETANVPNGIRFAWDWPDNVQPPRVLSYPELMVGHKPWGGTTDQSIASRVSDLKDFGVDFDLSIAGETGGYNVAFEFWLQSRPAGSSTDITTEVMVWVHNGNLVAPGDTGIKYVDGGYRSTINTEDGFGVGGAETWRYIALSADIDFLSGKLDFHDILVALERLGYVNPDDYVTGFELGAEVVGGTGGFTINDFSYTFAKHTVTDGADVVAGGSRNDNLRGRGGDDRVRGNGGDDWLYGGAGGDWMSGDGGNDLINGDADSDIFYGGAGFDTLNGGTGNDFGRGGDHADRLIGGDGDDRLFGDAGNDQLFGGAANDTLEGGSGNDTIFGGAGRDTLSGAGGYDRLDGGAGNDVVIGGTNWDIFVFSGRFGDDIIRGFDAANNFEDIVLTGSTTILNYADLAANHMTQVGANVVINDGLGNTITIENVLLANMDATNFVF
jgi:Ca2+-binding RTX toxin-like protein